MRRALNRRILPDPLSDKDILKLCDNQARLVTHDQIRNFRTVEDLLGPHGAAIILYATQVFPNDDILGHWVTVFRSPDDDSKIYYFDSYGKNVDNPLKYMTKNAIKKFGKYPYLTDLLQNFEARGGKVEVNKYKLQKQANDISTCGRLVGLRLQFRFQDNEEFYNSMNSYSKKPLTIDELAVLLTAFMGYDD